MSWQQSISHMNGSPFFLRLRAKIDVVIQRGAGGREAMTVLIGTEAPPTRLWPHITREHYHLQRQAATTVMLSNQIEAFVHTPVSGVW